jgi:hypothetical protein
MIRQAIRIDSEPMGWRIVINRYAKGFGVGVPVDAV